MKSGERMKGMDQRGGGAGVDGREGRGLVTRGAISPRPPLRAPPLPPTFRVLPPRQSAALQTLLGCYEPFWLQLGLETVVGAPMAGPSTEASLRAFVQARLWGDAGEAGAEGAGCGAGPAWAPATHGASFLKKLLLLAMLLDRCAAGGAGGGGGVLPCCWGSREFALPTLPSSPPSFVGCVPCLATAPLDPPSSTRPSPFISLRRAAGGSRPAEDLAAGLPLLFRRSAPLKASAALLSALLTPSLSGEGDVLRHLGFLGYQVGRGVGIVGGKGWVAVPRDAPLRRTLSKCNSRECRCPPRVISGE